MDLDDAAPPPAKRPSTAHDRPSRAPYGPRIRTRQKNSSDMASPGPPSADALASPPFSPTFSRPDSPGVEPTTSIDASLSHPPPPAPTPPPPSLPTHAHAAVQAPSTPPASSQLLPERPTSPSPPPPTPAPTLPSKSTTSPPKSAPGTFIAPPPLTPPPTITFEPTPIPWKGLPLEAAQWTFSSSELQEVVSKAIRLSARESFVRLLSLQALEVDIVQETERLDTARLAAQAKWRFEVGRRTMLMQALNSIAASSAPSGAGSGAGAGVGDNGGGSPIVGFIGQLASSIASCDSFLSSILHLSDQQSQIAVIQHQHWASALGIALRKLNKAYERQGQELKRVQARVQTLEDELEEAWQEAEKMAIEFDDLEQEIATSGTEDESEEEEEEEEEEESAEETDPDAGADTDADGYDASPVAKHDPDETGTLGDVTINTDIAVVLGVTATAVASKATLVTSPGSPRIFDKFDAKSVRSVKSTRSRSTRDGPSHISRLSAARVRSRAASNASLRLPKALRSTPSTHTSPVDVPPVPARPLSNVQGHSFLDMGNNSHEHVRKVPPPKRHPEPTLALPIPPHSAGLPPTRVPSIWLETDGGKSTRLNGLDRSHSLQIFSSLAARTSRKTRRSNLVMSLTGSDWGSEGSPVENGDGPSTDTGTGTSTGIGMDVASMGIGRATGRGTATASPTSNHSPVSLPTHAHTHFRGLSLSSTQSAAAPRPGSAGARLTTTNDTRAPMPVATPRRSLVSRASSVILRRLSQATMGGSKGPSSPSKSLRSNGGGRALVERWKERGREMTEEGEGEVMLIGSPRTESFDGP